MPMFTVKTLRKVIKEEIANTVGELHAQALRSAMTTFEKQQREKPIQDVNEAQARNERLVQANRGLVRQVTWLEQILHGLAQDEVRKALVVLADKIARRAQEQGMRSD